MNSGPANETSYPAAMEQDPLSSLPNGHGRYQEPRNHKRPLPEQPNPPNSGNDMEQPKYREMDTNGVQPPGEYEQPRTLSLQGSRGKETCLGTETYDRIERIDANTVNTYDKMVRIDAKAKNGDTTVFRLERLHPNTGNNTTGGTLQDATNSYDTVESIDTDMKTAGTTINSYDMVETNHSSMKSGGLAADTLSRTTTQEGKTEPEYAILEPCEKEGGTSITLELHEKREAEYATLEPQNKAEAEYTALEPQNKAETEYTTLEPQSKAEAEYTALEPQNKTEGEYTIPESREETGADYYSTLDTVVTQR